MNQNHRPVHQAGPHHSSPTIVVHPPVQAAGPRAVPDQQQRVQSSQAVDLSQEHLASLALRVFTTRR